MPRYLKRYPYRKKGICSWCGKAVKPPRTHWCSQECVDEWCVRSGSRIRSIVFKRDRGICSICGRDCEQLLRDLKKLYAKDRWNNCSLWYKRKTGQRITDTEYTREIERIGLTGERVALCKSLWDVDHIVPVVEGGGQCGLDNLRTLCWDCHNKETANLRKRLKQIPIDKEVWDWLYEPGDRDADNQDV